MRKPFLLLISFCVLTTNSCDDGDVIDFKFEFDDSFSACESATNLVFYNTKNEPSESVSVLINNLSIENILEVNEEGIYTADKTGTFNYRTYSDASIPNLFCNEIPPKVTINVDQSDSVTASIRTVLAEDDNDGIPAELEDINGNGNLKDDDTDGDGLPNYIDADDDGDNILTKDENPDPNNDNVLVDAQDTDGDETPDYLDADDDGDGVNTRDEENESQDNNPGNDVTNSDVGADYLNPDVANTVAATAYRTHTISQSYLVTLIVKEISIEFLSQQEFNFGVLENSKLSNTRTVTPDFN